MPDREKVIKGLECCNSLHNHSIVKCATDCPYWEFDANCRGFVIRDALALLKAQEPVDAIPVEWLRDKMRGYASSLKSTETAALVMVMQMWQKEQEAQGT